MHSGYVEHAVPQEDLIRPCLVSAKGAHGAACGVAPVLTIVLFEEPCRSEYVVLGKRRVAALLLWQILRQIVEPPELGFERPPRDPQADLACYDAIRTNLNPGIPIVEMDHTINDPEFSSRVADTLLGLLRA